jgi:hypothetical protein
MGQTERLEVYRSITGTWVISSNVGLVCWHPAQKCLLVSNDLFSYLDRGYPVARFKTRQDAELEVAQYQLGCR